VQGETDSGPTGERVAGLAATLLDDEALHDLLQRLTLLVNQTVADARSVSITISQDGQYRTLNSTGETALTIDEAQYRYGDGPCLEALRSARQVQVSVGEAPVGWAGFDEEAGRAGVGAVLSTPLLRSPEVAVGALNVYAHQGGEFGARDRETTGIVGELAAILVDRSLDLMSSTRLNEDLKKAVATREVIGTAKGILMQSQGCTRDEAFQILQRASQRENRKLRELAEELVNRVETRARSAGSQG
jgi:hypothetical protein